MAIIPVAAENSRVEGGWSLKSSVQHFCRAGRVQQIILICVKHGKWSSHIRESSHTISAHFFSYLNSVRKCSWLNATCTQTVATGGYIDLRTASWYICVFPPSKTGKPYQPYQCRPALLPQCFPWLSDFSC